MVRNTTSSVWSTAAVLLLLASSACKGDGIKRDADGCWTSGLQAHQEMGIRDCGSECSGGVEESVEAACVDYWQSLYELHRSQWCFDGCAVDACLEAWDQYLVSCTAEDRDAYLDQCFGAQAMFWDSDSTERPYTEECVGW